MQRYIKIIFFVFLLLLLVCLYFFIFYQKEEVNYIDTVDATVAVDDKIYAVGRNNNNDRELKKAKFTIYNSKQEKTYEKVYNRGYTSRFYDLLVDDENIVIVGSYEENKTDYHNKKTTAVILKYDENGQLLFEKEVKDAVFYDVLYLSDGYLAVGKDKKKDKSTGVIYKYHSDGSFAWKKTYEDGSSKFISSIYYENQIFVAGVKDNYGILVSYTENGDIIDFVVNDSTDSQGFSSITVVDHSIVLSGAKKESSNVSIPMLIKYDMDLNYVDSVCYDTKYSGRFFKVIADSNDDLIVLGNTIDKEKKIHHAYIGKYRSDLVEASVVPYYNEEDDYFTDISLMDDTYLVSGYSYYPKQGYLSKLLMYSEALKLVEVK